MYSNQPFIQISPLTEEEYLRWSGLLAERLGIIIPMERKMFLQSKIWSRMREIGYKDYAKYWDYINSGICLLYTSPSPRDKRQSRMPSSA